MYLLRNNISFTNVMLNFTLISQYSEKLCTLKLYVPVYADQNLVLHSYYMLIYILNT